MADESSRVAASFDGWVLLREPLVLIRDGKRSTLQELPLQILELLSSRPGQLVTREELVTHLWPLFVADHARAQSETRAALAAMGDAPDFTVGAYVRLMAARVFAWSGANDEAVKLLVRLSTRYPGVGPAAITRDPLISMPLAEHAGFRKLAKQLEGEIALNQNLLRAGTLSN